MHMSYWRFAAMIATSTIVMFGLMYLNTYAREHILWSETRMWMAFLMGACMAVIMLSYMLNMYQSKATNIGIYLGSILVFGVALWLVRSQATVNQVEYMKAMIPHHSIAIMTSNRARITDPRVRKLADEIIEAQEREIAEMKFLIGDLEESDQSTPPEKANTAELVSAAEAIGSPNIAQSDPASMTEAEVGKVLAGKPHCGFSYTQAGRPVFAVGPASESEPVDALLKLHGKLVQLNPEGGDDFQAIARSGGVFTADGIRVEVAPLTEESGDDGRPANLRFHLERELEVGYRGWYSCGD